jgi:hypothetical protein
MPGKLGTISLNEILQSNRPRFLDFNIFRRSGSLVKLAVILLEELSAFLQDELLVDKPRRAIN